MRLMFPFLLALAAQAQQRPAARAEFEVVSVKPGDPSFPGTFARPGPGGLEMRNATLKNLLLYAYGLNEYQLEGGLKWLDSAKFDIDAKYPAGAPASQAPLMMQAMLADRFKLQFHRETKVRPEYALVVAKGGPKLQAATEEEHPSSSQGDRLLKGSALPTSRLASMLIGVVGAPVLDQTGLTGKYDVDLKFAPLLETAVEDENLPDIFAALQDKLGLKLEAIKGPVEVLVIDRAEMPTAN
jgi:uncharacterized protein (TIGR03435 family)